MSVKIMAIVLIVAAIVGLLYGKFSYQGDSRHQAGPDRDVGCEKADGQRPSLGRRGVNSIWWWASTLCEQKELAQVVQ